MQIGAKIYYEKQTGNVILTCGDMQGFIVESSFDEDFETYSVFKKYNKEQVGCIQLEFGELDKLLIEHKANTYRVDISQNPHKLVFSYINHENEEVEPPKTIEEIIDEKIKEAKSENALGIAELYEKTKKDKLELSTAIAEVVEMVTSNKGEINEESNQ